jgi:hypothetical protein
LNNPSKIAELQELEHWDKKFAVAGNATDGFFSKRWVAEHMLGISEDEFIRMQREMFYDSKFTASLESAGEAPEAGGEPGGDLDLGGDDAGGDLDLGGDEGGGDLDLGGDEGDKGGDDEEDVLLAAPGKRNDKRGPYKKHQTVTPKGGFKKQMKNVATGEYGNTSRSIWKGKVGFGGLDSLGRGITEQKTLDTIEEEKLFNTSVEVDALLEGLKKLEKNENESKTQ